MIRKLLLALLLAALPIAASAQTAIIVGNTPVTNGTPGSALTTGSNGRLSQATGFPAISLPVGIPLTGGSANCLIYDLSNTVGCLVTGNNGVMVTNGSGVPSISTTLPSGLALGTPASLALTNATGLPSASLLTPSALAITSSVGNTATSLAIRFGQSANVQTDFGTACDFQTVVATVTMGSGSAALTAVGATFALSDVGKKITILGAGVAGAPLGATISAFINATHVTLSVSASTAVTAHSQYVYYGTDNTASINAAAATGRPVYLPGCANASNGLPYQYLITDQISLSNNQSMYGDGVIASSLAADANFNLNAFGIIRAGTSETGAAVSNIGISFAQPDTTVYADLIQYPPGIFAQSVAGVKTLNVRCIAAIICIDGRGNTGHAFYQNTEGSAFDKLVALDGAQDIVWIDQLNAYPYGLGANQATIMAARGIGIDAGRVDSFFFRGVQSIGMASSLYLHVGANGVSIPNGNISDIYSGDGGGVRMAAGWLSVGSFRAGLALAPDFALKQTGGTLTIGSSNVYTIGAQSGPLVSFASTATSTASSIAPFSGFGVLTVGGTLSGNWGIGQYVGGSTTSANTQITYTTITGNVTAGSNVVSGTTTTGLQAGMQVFDPNGSVPAGATIVSITNGTTMALSRRALASATAATYTITGSGTGGAGTYIVNNSQTVTSAALSGTVLAGGLNGTGEMAIQIGAAGFNLLGFDNTAFYSDGGGNQVFNLSNLYVQRAPDIAYTQPSVLINTGFGSINGLTTTGLGAGTGTLIQISSSGFAQLTSVDPNGWTVSIPGGHNAQTFVGNIDAPSYSVNGTTAATTINGTSCALGSSCTITAAASSITSGSTTATGFTNGHLVGVSGGKTADVSLGTGVLTALGVNIGSAGAPVLFNGAAGTPSSLVLTNATALPASALPAFTGDVTTSAGASATTLATVATGATTGSSTAIPVVTFNNKGLVTAITTAAVVAPAGTLSGATLAAGVTASSLTSAAGGSFGTAAYVATGTSGATVPKLDGVNTWSGAQTISSAAGATFTLNSAAANYGILRFSSAGTPKWDWALDASTNALYAYNQSVVAMSLNFSTGAATFANNVSAVAGNFSGPVRPGGYIVSTLPASPGQGATAYVTDAVACTFLAAVTGGGATFCPVNYNGSAWVGG